MSDIYYTIEGAGESQYKEKMSRFLSFAIPVSDAEEAKGEVKRFQNRFHDARHVCWAYMIGPDRLEWQLNDNGEPSGPAGKPILGQINSFELTNVLVIVVRYFGGIKLGTSGLIAAYREAAREAIEAGSIIQRSEMAQLSFTFPYLSMNDVMRLVKDTGVKVVSQEFDNACSMTVAMPSDDMERFTARLLDIDGTSL